MLPMYAEESDLIVASGTLFYSQVCGYGGSCFLKTYGDHSTAEENGSDFSLLKSVEAVNERQNISSWRKVRAYLETICVDTSSIWGLAFKPRTDDMREALPWSLSMNWLRAEVAAHDPEALTQAQKVFGDRISYHRMNYDTLTDADALLIVTEWNEFRRPDFKRMRDLMKSPLIFDGRNLYEPAEMRQEGFTYYPVGRPSVVQS
jgi:UDPglucose 6-dehydrogenase